MLYLLIPTRAQPHPQSKPNDEKEREGMKPLSARTIWLIWLFPFLFTPTAIAWLFLDMNVSLAAIHAGQCHQRWLECNTGWVDWLLPIIAIVFIAWHITLIVISKNKITQILYAVLNLGLSVFIFEFIAVFMSGEL